MLNLRVVLSVCGSTSVRRAPKITHTGAPIAALRRAAPRIHKTSVITAPATILAHHQSQPLSREGQSWPLPHRSGFMKPLATRS
jgi:hypothetical protein